LNYSTMLKQSIEKKEYSLAQVCFQLAKRDIWLDKAILSKMQNGKFPPAKDEINILLAEILGIDPVKFRIAAVKATMSPELFKLVKEAG
jgi:hypothetical protein